MKNEQILAEHRYECVKHHLKVRSYETCGDGMHQADGGTKLCWDCSYREKGKMKKEGKVRRTDGVYWCAFHKVWIDTFRTCADGKNQKGETNTTGQMPVLCWDCVYYDTSESRGAYQISQAARTLSLS